MVLKYPLVVKIAIPVIIVCLVVFHLVGRKKKYSGGKRAANTYFIRNHAMFKKLTILQTALGVIMELAIITALVASSILIARPVKKETMSNGTKKRDIFLCMDVSYSIYQLNYDLVDSLEEVVKGLDGDRFGISIFNTSTVLYVPMTDDYDFILSKLEELKEYFRLQKKYMQAFEGNTYFSDEEYDELSKVIEDLSYFDAGTLVNNYTKGSSLIGEGLASALYSFPKIDDEDRTRLIIFSTDNSQEARQTPLVELDEACELCAGHNIKVFGIFPSEKSFYKESSTPYETAMQGLKEAINVTGGTFYQESYTLSVKDMVEDIEAQEALEVQEMTITKLVDKPVVFMIILFTSLAVVMVVGLIRML